MTIPKIAVHALCLLLLVAHGFAQGSKPPVDIPRAVVSDVQKTPDGGLLIAVRLHASNTKQLNLSRPPLRHNPNVPMKPGDNDPLPFSLAGSTLRDLYDDKVYASLPMLPHTPFVGPMEILTAINPGGWMQLGVAFPPIPPPPEKDGKKQPYQLLLEINELKIHTLIKLDPNTLKPQ